MAIPAPVALMLSRYSMPVYQYHCRSCGHDFQHTEPLREHGHTRTACPKCKSTQVGQVLTPFLCENRTQGVTVP